MFIQPIVITVENKRAISFAVDARAMNQELVKDKRPDPNLEILMALIAKGSDCTEKTP